MSSSVVAPTELSAASQEPPVSASVKTQMLPLVYIQAPQKIPFTPTNNNNNNNTNVVVNTVPQLQFATLPTTRNLVPANQGVILAPVKGKAQQLVIHKQASLPVSTGSKLTGAYLTMIKPLSKTTNDTLGHLGGGGISGIGAGQNNQSGTGRGQKIVIAPMPKVIKNSNRLPVTVTTNSLQPKFAFMPLLPPSSAKAGVMGTTEVVGNNSKMFNLKISDGKLRDECGKTIDIVTAPSGKSLGNCGDLSADQDDVFMKPEKEYELSIMEEVNNSSNERRKFAKHGISILKKNYHPDPKRNTVNNNSNNNNNVNNAPKAVVETEAEVSVENKPKPVKAGRRRKSNFSYRRDYDELEMPAQINKPVVLPTDDEVLIKVDDDVNEVIEDPAKESGAPLTLTEDRELKTILKWEGGIGSLPGSSLKFIINEFNLVEYVTSDEYHKIIEKRLAKVKTKHDFQEDLRCVECGCYGLPSEFITPKYCSLDCQEAGNIKLNKEKDFRLKSRKRKKVAITTTNTTTTATTTTSSSSAIINTTTTYNNNTNTNNNSREIEIKVDISGSDEEDTSNENSQDKMYPWTCSKKGFSWTKYLDHIKAKAAPVKLFKDPFPYNRNGFRSGMKLEGIDPLHPSYFCVLSVAEICGYRVRLHFDGYPDNYDFWINADSTDIFPPGWCEKHGYVLQPPPGYTVDSFNWINYLKQTRSTAAPKHLFANRTGNSICPNGFRIGMKLEAVDRKNTSLVCVATVRNMMDNRILIHFDSWDDIYDYWADPTSAFIHPVGWCDQYGHKLTPPNDYPNPETFSWSKYLKETKSAAAPVRAFKQRPACGFKRGMRLECVDKRVPQLIRVACISEIKDHQIRIAFDGWLDRYSYWVDDDSEDIHPVGWCQKTGHPIETPLTPDDVYDFLECPTVGCRGLGHTQGPKFATHCEQKYCPYAEDNIDIERILPDRLLTPDRLVEAVVPISIEPKEKIKGKFGRLPKYQKFEPKTEEPQDDPTPPPLITTLKQQRPPQKRKYKKRLKLNSDLDEHQTTKLEALALIEQSKIEPAEKECWQKHTKFLHKYIKEFNDDIDDDDDDYDDDGGDDSNNIKLWTSERIAEFISGLPGCECDGEQFKLLDIDGEAFLSLNQNDLINILNMKLGPAIKLYNIIVLLRQRFKDFNNPFS